MGKVTGSVNRSRVPPVWILSLPFLTSGMMLGFTFVTLPQMLATQGVPGGRIAVVVAISGSPSFWGFLLAPFLDVRFKRRTYALIFGVLAVVAPAMTVFYRTSLAEVEVVMLIGVLSSGLSMYALGGWFGSISEKERNTRLGAWTTVYNICGGGIGVLVSGYAAERLAPGPASALIFISFLVPLSVCSMIPAPSPEKIPASENFSRFARETVFLLKRSEVLVALALLALPSASFALTNVLGGWSGNFHATPSLVSVVGGGGIILGGIVGSLTVPIMARTFPLRPLYLSIGLIGAVFTLSLLLLPRVPATYGLGFVGENIFQSAAIATALAIIYQVIGPSNPLAATTFALLFAAMNMPIDYMAAVDGRGYEWSGITGAFVADALVSGSACILLAIVLRHRLLPGRPEG